MLDKYFNADRIPFWIGLASFSVLLLGISQFFFVDYLYMRPCVECVYIRFAVSLLFFISCIAVGFLSSPRLHKGAKWEITDFVTKLCMAVCCFGLWRSWLLMEKSESCSINGEEFSLFGLENLFPSLFKPTGECGFSAPLPPVGAKFEGLQASLINLYTEAEGWYLIPQWHFGTLAQCTFVIFLLLLIVVLFAYTPHPFRSDY